MRFARAQLCLFAAVICCGCHKDSAPATQSLTAGGPFEGTITVRYEDAAKPATTLTYEIKGSKFRVNLPEETNQGKKGYLLFDADGKKALLVLDDRKVFLAIDLSSANVGGAVLPKLDGAAKLDKDGKTEAVAGYECRDWAISTDSGRSELCVVEGVPWFSFGSGPASPDQPSWLTALATGKYFPLRVVTRDKDGATKKKMEATKIERAKIDDARLSSPADYREVDMKELLTPAVMSAIPLHP